MTLRSVPGAGSTFTVELLHPTKATSSAADRQAKARAMGSSHRTPPAPPAQPRLILLHSGRRLQIANGAAIATVKSMSRLSQAVVSLLIVNIAVFVAGALSPDWEKIILARGAFHFPGNEAFAPAQAVTYMFLHANLGHIFFNMFALLSFGALLEREWGAPRFLIFYFLCGLGAGLIQTGINGYEFNQLYERLVAAGLTPASIDTIVATGRGAIPADPALEAALVELYRIYNGWMVGASGAVYGVLVAFGLRHPNAKLALIFVPVPIAAKYFIPALLGLDLLSEFTGFSLFGAGIAHFAHVGGAAIGLLLTVLWRKHRLSDADLHTDPR